MTGDSVVAAYTKARNIKSGWSNIPFTSARYPFTSHICLGCGAKHYNLFQILSEAKCDNTSKEPRNPHSPSSNMQEKVVLDMCVILQSLRGAMTTSYLHIVHHADLCPCGGLLLTAHIDLTVVEVLFRNTSPQELWLRSPHIDVLV
jgi:hypothetical protein